VFRSTGTSATLPRCGCFQLQLGSDSINGSGESKAPGGVVKVRDEGRELFYVVVVCGNRLGSRWNIWELIVK